MPWGQRGTAGTKGSAGRCHENTEVRDGTWGPCTEGNPMGPLEMGEMSWRTLGVEETP